MIILAVLLNVGGGLALAFSFKASKEAKGLTRWYKWGYGTAVAFNRGLFWLGVFGLAVGNVFGAIR